MGIAFLGYSHRSTGVYQTLRCLYAPSFRLAAFLAVTFESRGYYQQRSCVGVESHHARERHSETSR